MMINVFIEPHERYDALEAYGQWLTQAQIDEIKDAPETAIVRLLRSNGQTTVTVIEEG